MSKLHMRTHNTEGTLITFCGLDGCGKSTMIQRLSRWLEQEGKDLFLTKQPTDFVRNSQIFRTYMDEPNHDAYDYRSLSLLAASDRVQHSNKVILPKLQQEKCVISDRYIYSCVANLWGRGYTEDKWIYEIVGSVVQPDLAFFLDVPVETAVWRVRSREAERNRYIDMELQYALRKAYQKLAEENNGILLSSLAPEEETFEKVKLFVQHYMEGRKWKQKDK